MEGTYSLVEILEPIIPLLDYEFLFANCHLEMIDLYTVSKS